MTLIDREARLAQLRELLSYSPVVAILGPRQCGKTTLAKMIVADHYFDLENPRDLARLENPQTALEKLDGLVCFDEIQLKSDFFPLLRHLVDQHPKTQYLILGSASEELIQKGSQSLAGRIAFLHLHGFDLVETGVEHVAQRWFRGGFPRAYLAPSEKRAAVGRITIYPHFWNAISRISGSVSHRLPCAVSGSCCVIVMEESSTIPNSGDRCK